MRGWNGRDYSYAVDVGTRERREPRRRGFKDLGGSLPIEPLRDQILLSLSARDLLQEFKQMSSGLVNDAGAADMIQDSEWCKQKVNGFARLQGRF